MTHFRGQYRQGNELCVTCFPFPVFVLEHDFPLGMFGAMGLICFGRDAAGQTLCARSAPVPLPAAAPIPACWAAL